MSSWRGANTVLSTTNYDGTTTATTGSSSRSSNALSIRRRTSNHDRTNTNDSSTRPSPPGDYHTPNPTSPQQHHHTTIPAGDEVEEETVEAVLNRLMKSYTVAMECINVFHKLETANFIPPPPPPPPPRSATTTTTTTATEEEDTSQRQLLLLFRVGRAARHTLEHSILRNPIVVQVTRTSFHTATTMRLPHTLSPSHVSTVRQIAYLSYINYADLLLMGLSRSESTTATTTVTTLTRNVLDRGVVKSLRTSSITPMGTGTTPTSCWVSSSSSATIRSSSSSICKNNNNSDTGEEATSTDNQNLESNEATVRLAITAYMNALSMDASDPTVYIKLACAARRLNRILLSSSLLSSSNNVTIKYAPYRKLERYALEHAMTALPMNHVPVNRTAQRALQEWWEEEKEEDDNDMQSSAENPDKSNDALFPMPAQHLTMALPRYSWSTFGRMLLRACKDGTLYHPSSSSGSPTDATSSSFGSLGSPTMHIHLSPLIALPTVLLSKVVSFLSPKQLWPLEATCRAISASMVSVRVLINNDTADGMVSDRKVSIPLRSVVPEQMKDPNRENMIGVEPPSILPTAFNQVATNDAVSDMNVEAVKRKSSRVQSQMITSSKRIERQNRRNSTEFCFLASILGCSTTDDPIYVRMVHSYDNHIQQQSIMDSADTRHEPVSVTDVVAVPHLVHTATKSQPFLRQYYYWNDASLYSFIHDSIAKLNHPSPLACMFRFVAHASIYASQVFVTASDTTILMDMQSNVLDCIECMNHRTNLRHELVSCWSLCKSFVPKDANMDDIQLFAIDLIHAELRLRRCETEEFDNCDFDSDSNFTSRIISPLLEIASTMDNKSHSFEGEQASIWKTLKARCRWMVANWYFWRGRWAANVGESRQAEEEGLMWVEETKKCFSGSESIQTPHLPSSLRKGQHWKDLALSKLSSFIDEVQASAVVLLAQEQFLDVATSVAAGENNRHIGQANCDSLANIGEILMERYSTTTDKSKSVEIIENFISIHGEQLSTLFDSDKAACRNWFADLIPSAKIEPNGTHKFPTSPAILTIFVTCLRTRDDLSISIAVLLSRLVLTLVDLSESILARQKIQWDKKMNSRIADDLLSDYESDIDDDFLSVDDNGEFQSRKQKLSADDLRLQKYSALVCLILQRMLDFCKEAMSLADQLLFLQSNDFASTITRSLAYTGELYRSSQPQLMETSSTNNDFGILVSVRELFQFTQSIILDDTLPWLINLAQRYIEGMLHIIIVQRQVLSSLSKFKPSKNRRNERLRAVRKRANLVATACFDIGYFLSTKLVSLDSDRIVCSEIVSKLRSSQKIRLVAACDSLLWFWKAATDVNVTDSHLSSYLDEFGRERLRVPVAILIVGLCGSTLSESPVVSALSNQLVSLSEFYDSDASAMELITDSDDEDYPDNNKNKPSLLRVIMQAIHCVCNVFGALDEKEVCSYSYIENYITPFGPGLPLVVARVLNIFANRLLQGFNQHEINGRDIWGEYSLGIRSVGFLLDSTLWKTYKCLHGFVLTNDTKDTTGGTINSTGGTKSAECFPSESKEAAAMLYRCIMRTYALGRRAPPKAALETVLAALPHLDESSKSSSIRHYLFSAKLHGNETDRLLSLALQRPGWNDTFASIEGFDWIHAVDSETSVDETSIVRRGLARLMAHGPIPRLQDNGDEKDWRSTSLQSEEDLSTKFSAVIDDLCFGDATDWEGWFKASQCLNLKSDLIADRLGLSRGFSRNPKFSIQEKRGTATYSYSLLDLKAKHDREQHQHDDGWIRSIGTDLSVFIRYHWSSFNCLKTCYMELGKYFGIDEKFYKTDNADDRIHWRSWLDIKTLYDANDFGLWQQALGGLFVSSLRLVAYRCFSLALYMLYQKDSVDCNFHSELAETLGINLYVELMGSQSYGYPMKVLAVKKRRDLATESLACFERAIACLQSDDDSTDKLQAWSLFFMVGKCHEKIARSFDDEAFTTDSAAPRRMHEHHMSLALNAYAESVVCASRIKEKGGFISEQNGGSSHGVMEAFYRLHATRLKCLISAVDKSDDEREFAEQEALRLTECHWFQNPERTVDEHSLRTRIWQVFEDVTAALAKCSLDNSYFHRSVYRHAQALMWAPFMYNPTEEEAKSSLGNVPATWACKIRGLNYSTSAASSALAIINSLFTKKRAQLVAVWVTMDSETTPLETINRSARKYDSLRGKYIAAYIDSLRMCRRRKELDMFLSWTNSCARDLPSHFAESALLEGAMPTHAPTVDCLVTHDRSIASFYFLKSVRRHANSALAKVILEDMNDLLPRKSSKPAETVKFFETQLKIAYACFLRLNCTFEEIAKRRSWLYEKQSGLFDVMEALTGAFTNAYNEATKASRVYPSDWSGESQLITTAVAALQKCKELYPSLSRNFSFTRQRAPSKPKSPSFSASSKRKISPNHETKSFEVAIPEGLKKGETFLTSIAIGDTTKRVRLTVPSESASSLRFSLEVPITDADHPSGADGNSRSNPIE